MKFLYFKDDEYLAQREKIKLRRPKHIGEGVAQGFSSLLMGVGEGIAGKFLFITLL